MTEASYGALVLKVVLLIAISWVVWKIWTFFKPRQQHYSRSVAIVVLGDVGRSPRMMYHAESFAQNGFETEIIGYGGSKPIPSLERLPLVQLRYLPEPPKFLQLVPFVLAAPVKIFIQVVSILLELLVRVQRPPEFIVVQNPPSIPTLALVWLVARVRGSKVIIDWHNLGYSILALKVGNNHPFVKISKWFEETFGRNAYAHLFVTQAMHDYLVREWKLQGKTVVLHDRPPRHFHRASPQETHELFIRLQPSLQHTKPLHGFLPSSSIPYSTPFTHSIQVDKPTQPAPLMGETTFSRRRRSISHRASISSPEQPYVGPTYTEIKLPTLRPDRPALLVSSTSWTADEDFSILLEALEIYDVRAKELDRDGGGRLPKLLAIVTGKGPMREEYMNKVKKLQEGWEWVRCVSLWLEAEDYPILLGSADLGVSLHTSSSALDLPMKVVDMFGCGLPVCALDFACLNELVKSGKNGLVFKNAPELADQLETLFINFPESSSKLSSLRANIAKASSSQSHSHWHGKQYQHHANSEAIKEEEAGETLAGEDGWRWGSWEENWNERVKPLILSDIGRTQ